jgi:hypothetical protein
MGCGVSVDGLGLGLGLGEEEGSRGGWATELWPDGIIGTGVTADPLGHGNAPKSKEDSGEDPRNGLGH